MNSLGYLREFTLSKSKNKLQRGRQLLSWILKHRIQSAENISEASPLLAGRSFPAKCEGFPQRENPGKNALPSTSGVGGKAEPGRELGEEGAASLLQLCSWGEDKIIRFTAVKMITRLRS